MDPAADSQLPPVDFISRLRGERRVRVRLRAYVRNSGWVAALGLAVVLATVIETANIDDPKGSLVLAFAIDLAILLVFGTLSLRICLGGVLVGQSDVIVRNPFRSYTLAWKEIDRFEFGGGGFPRLARAITRDGRFVSIAAVRGDAGKRQAESQALVDGLNTLLSERSH